MKALSLLTGIAIVALLAGVLVANFGGGAFTTHMIVHIGIVAIAAPLVAYGLAGTPYNPLRDRVGLFPLLASLVELAVVWIWHVPAMRLAADASLALSIFEQVSFLAAGLLLWLACIRPGDGRLAGAVGLLFTSMHMTLLGVLLTLAPRPLYAAGGVTCFGIPLSATADQQVGGVIMLTIGAVAYLLGGIVLLAGLLQEDKARC